MLGSTATLAQFHGFHQSIELKIPSNPYYKLHQIPELKCISSLVAVVFAQSIEVMGWVENENVFGAALLDYIWVMNI